MTVVLTTRASSSARWLKQAKLSPVVALMDHTHTHRTTSYPLHTSSRLRKEEDYEIDLITLKKRPKRKRDLKEVINIVSSSRAATKEANPPADQNSLKETLFDDAIKFVKDDKKTNINQQAEPTVDKPDIKVEVRMPPLSDQSKPVIELREEREEEEVVNVQRPKIIISKESTPTDAFKENMVSEHSQSNGSTHSIQDILKLVSKEVPELSKEATKLADDIEDNIARMKEIRTKIAEAEKREQEALKTFLDQNEDLNIKREDLEKFLNDAKLTKELDDEEHFREQRRFEWTQSLQSSRSLSQNNFFTPIDEKLIKSVKKSPFPRPSPTQSSDDILFPTLPKVSPLNMTHEYLVHINGKQIVTHENPFGPHYLPPDLVSIFHELGDLKPYMKTINKLENSKWRLIGTEPVNSNHVLVFERYIDKQQEKKYKRISRLKTLTWIALGAFGTLNLIGFLNTESSKGSQWSIDKDGELVKRAQ